MTGVVGSQFQSERMSGINIHVRRELKPSLFTRISGTSKAFRQVEALQCLGIDHWRFFLNDDIPDFPLPATKSSQPQLP